MPSGHARTPGPLEPILLPGSINLLAGSSGAGKTAFLAFLAKQLQMHAPVFGVQSTLASAPYQAYIGVNRSWEDSSSRWFNLEGVKLPHYSLVDDGKFKKDRKSVV